MLKGSTQGRATQFGVVVIPRRSEQIPVHCIHASKGIRPGAMLQTSGYTPQRVYSTILGGRSQRRTWSEIYTYSSRLSSYSPEMRHALANDDLMGTVENFTRFRRDLEDILKQIPDHVNQVGTVVIDPDGVVGFEMYDHPDSWKGFSQTIMRSYTEALTKEDKTEIFKPDMTATIPLIHQFLRDMEQATEEEVFSKNKAKTTILKSQGYVGEYTTLNGKTIHLLITRYNNNQVPTRKTEQPRFTHPPQSSVQRVTNWGKRFKRKMKKAIRVLTTLQDEPKTWTDIRSRVSMSKATLSSRLKELQELQTVEKHKNRNGTVRYSLTGIGHEFLLYKEDSTGIGLSSSAPVGGASAQRFQSTRVANFPPQLHETRKMEIHTPQSDFCPKCNSPDTTIWGFNQNKVSLECQVCHHIWTKPRK